MKSRSSLEAYLFIAPPLAVLFILIGYPVIYNIYLSFFQSGYGVHRFVGLSNYVQAFKSAGFGTILLNTLIWTVGNMAVMLILGLFAALSLNRELRGKTAIQVLLLIPWVVPFVVTGVMWTFLFQPRWGAINDILLRLNIISERILWLEKPNTALMSTMIAYVWKVYPYVMVLLLAGMKSIPEEVYDAAEVDGANGLRRLVHITLPMLRSILSTIMLVVGIWTFNAFDLIYVMTGGGPIYSSETIAMRIYKLAFMDFRFGLSSATSMIASVILVVLCIIYPRLEKE